LALFLAGALLLRSLLVFGAGGTLFLFLWLSLAVLLPMGITQLHRTLPATFERLAGDPDRWIFELSSNMPEGGPFAGTRFAGTGEFFF